MSTNLLLDLAHFIFTDDEIRRLAGTSLLNAELILELIAPVGNETASLDDLAVSTKVPLEKIIALTGLYQLCIHLEGLGAKRSNLLYLANITQPEDLTGEDAKTIHAKLQEAERVADLGKSALPPISLVKQWQWLINSFGITGQRDRLGLKKEFLDLVENKKQAARKHIVLFSRYLLLFFALIVCSSMIQTVIGLRLISQPGFSCQYITPLVLNDQNCLQTAKIYLWGIAVSMTTSAAIGVGLFYLVSRFYFTMSLKLSIWFIMQVALPKLDNQQARLFLGLNIPEKRDRTIVLRATGWMYFVILLAGGVFVYLLNFDENFSYREQSYVLLGWLSLALLAWAFFFLSTFTLRVLYNAKVSENNVISKGVEYDLLSSYLQLIFAVIFLVGLANGVSLYLTYSNRLSSFIHFRILSLSPVHASQLFAYRLFGNLESDLLTDQLFKQLVVLPGFLVLVLLTFVLFVAFQPRRAFIYGGIIIGGGMGMEYLSQKGLEIWAGVSFASFGFPARLILLLVISLVLDGLFNLVIIAHPGRASKAVKAPFWILRILQFLSVPIGVIAILGSLGLLPFLDLPYLLTTPPYQRSENSVVDKFGIPMAVVKDKNRRFYVDMFEATIQDYSMCVNSGQCDMPDQTDSATRESYYFELRYQQYPVIYISQENSKNYCAWRNKRLPTEEEWLLAYSSNMNDQFPWGNNLILYRHANLCDQLCKYWWNWDDQRFEFTNRYGQTIEQVGLWKTFMDPPSQYFDGFEDTSPMGSHPLGSSPYGVQDMVGNVSEWTSEGYLMGGNFMSSFIDSETYWKTNPNDPLFSASFVGFRCVANELP